MNFVIQEEDHMSDMAGLAFKSVTRYSVRDR
jgi:hypothetical protein